MVIVFVHGWSVRNTNTYGQLPARLKKTVQAGGGSVRVENVYLGQYVSFDDAVTLDDIARALDFALREKLYNAETRQWTKFACITHSTGGPVVRLWMELFYGKDRLAACPMSHLIMLAPANHGSALAQLGKSRLSRIKFFFEGAEPGARVLDWLELGSSLSWDLNTKWLDYDCASAGVWVFTLTGQKIDRSLYDHLNSYTGEPGSDGVVRVAAANINYQAVRLVQKGKKLVLDAQKQARPTALGILPGRAHSGLDNGIIRSVKATGDHPTLTWVTRCLGVADAATYEALSKELDALSTQTQKDERVEVVERKFLPDQKYFTNRYSMVVFRLRNDRGDFLSDYDLILTAGPDYSPDDLPTGFFVDRQRNSRNPGQLTYYLDNDAIEKLRRGGEGRIGFKILARPDKGLAFYQVAEFQSDTGGVRQFFRPNETTMVDIVVNRKVDAQVFRISEKLPQGDKGEDISNTPTGTLVP